MVEFMTVVVRVTFVMMVIMDAYHDDNDNEMFATHGMI